MSNHFHLAVEMPEGNLVCGKPQNIKKLCAEIPEKESWQAHIFNVSRNPLTNFGSFLKVYTRYDNHSLYERTLSSGSYSQRSAIAGG
jgi:hypothetical protein